MVDRTGPPYAKVKPDRSSAAWRRSRGPAVILCLALMIIPAVLGLVIVGSGYRFDLFEFNNPVARRVISNNGVMVTIAFALTWLIVAVRTAFRYRGATFLLLLPAPLVFAPIIDVGLIWLACAFGSCL
jgi:hypothetical protein